jgi:hypothetical protein
MPLTSTFEKNFIMRKRTKKIDDANILLLEYKNLQKVLGHFVLVVENKQEEVQMKKK